MLRRLVLGLAAAGLLLAAGAPGKAAAPAIDPGNFSARVDNPWYPLRPGTTYVYRGMRDGQPSVDRLTVTGQVARIAGASCVVVHDALYGSGRLAERTTDWYTQDRQGNVWYFGEATAELDRKGHVTSRAGSWRAGVDGAVPGIYMPAHPRAGQSARQEFYKGQAEDHFRVLSLGAWIAVPFVSSHHALLTEEWTPLEPAVLDHKVYVRGTGTVKEEAVKGPQELAVLVSVSRR